MFSAACQLDFLTLDQHGFCDAHFPFMRRDGLRSSSVPCPRRSVSCAPRRASGSSAGSNLGLAFLSSSFFVRARMMPVATRQPAPRRAGEPGRPADCGTHGKALRRHRDVYVRQKTHQLCFSTSNLELAERGTPAGLGLIESHARTPTRAGNGRPRQTRAHRRPNNYVRSKC